MPTRCNRLYLLQILLHALCNKICNKYHLLYLVVILFPYNFLVYLIYTYWKQDDGKNIQVVKMTKDDDVSY